MNENNMVFNMKQKLLITIILLLTLSSLIHAQKKPQDDSSIMKFEIYTGSGGYYTVRYKGFKPDDVPQEVYDRLFEIQLEVINNFTYDYAVYNGKKKRQNMYTKEDFYKYGKGVCEHYADFFIILAQEKGITENLYKISGIGHAWLEYRTENNVYIIDPTWSDDYAYTAGNSKELFKESPAYGKPAFFITYQESRIIFGNSLNHNFLIKGKTETALWKKDERTKADEKNNDEEKK